MSVSVSQRSDAPSPTPRAADLGEDSTVLADALQSAVPELVGRIEMTEDNDANDLIGRPGQYDQASFIGDDRLGCKKSDDYNTLDTACGVKIERWLDAAAAQARGEDIQRKLRDYGLGAEYDYVVGRLLLRLSGDYKPSQAAAIQRAAGAGAPVRAPE